MIKIHVMNEYFFNRKKITKCCIIEVGNGVVTLLINGLLFLVKRDEVENSKATVIITHGIAEHSGRYKEITAFLNEQGYNVVRYDLRGHGQSQGKRGKLKSFHHMIDDLHGLVLHEKQLEQKHIFLLGHSMGGLIVDMYAVKYGDVDGIITSAAPSYFVKETLPLRFIGYKWLGFLRKKTNFADGRLSRDKAVEKAYIDDPLNLKYFHVSLAGNMMISGVRYLNNNMKDFSLPVLILHGGSDKITPPEFSQRFYDLITVKDKKLIIYLDSYHEILNDYDKKKVMKDITIWLDKHTEVAS